MDFGPLGTLGAGAKVSVELEPLQPVHNVAIKNVAIIKSLLWVKKPLYNNAIIAISLRFLLTSYPKKRFPVNNACVFD
jgi:type III secretory pathway component EscU